MTEYPSPNKYVGRLVPVRLVVLHSTETPTNSAIGVARGFQNPARPASAHHVVDAYTSLTCVDEGDTAWAAPGANADGIQIEMCGFAYSTDWKSGEGARVVENAASVLAGVCERHNIPLIALSDAGLASGARGIVTHAQVSRVYKKSDHTDPGPAFPLADLIAAASGASPLSSTDIPEQGDNDMFVIKTFTPWNAEAYALITAHDGADALDNIRAQAYASGLGKFTTVSWDFYGLLVREAWQRHETFLTALGKTVAESVDAATARVLDAARGNEK
ncbi:MAG: peptidoglycan recognition protein family protein [Schaalia turicensis]